MAEPKIPNAAYLIREEIQAKVVGTPAYKPTKWDRAIAAAATEKCWPIAYAAGVAESEAKNIAAPNDQEPQCWRCGRILAAFVTRPWSLRCSKCKAENHSMVE